MKSNLNVINIDLNEIDIEQILLQRLEQKGVASNNIPGLLRDVKNSFSISLDMNHFQVNHRLHYLGWNDFELDYHTFRLAKEYFEDNGLIL